MTRAGDASVRAPRFRCGVLVACTFAGAASVASCELFTAPIQFERPELVALEIDEFALALRDDGVMLVRAILPDTLMELSDDERVAVIVAASSGDRERLGLYHLTCPVGSPFRGFHCHKFSIHLSAGYDADRLRDRVRAIGGREVRLTSTWLVVVGEFRRIVSFAKDADNWPGVEFASLSYSLCYGCNLKSFLTGPLPLDVGAPNTGDGILQFVRGDTIRVRYENPSGSVLGVGIVVP